MTVGGGIGTNGCLGWRLGIPLVQLLWKIKVEYGTMQTKDEAWFGKSGQAGATGFAVQMLILVIICAMQQEGMENAIFILKAMLMFDIEPCIHVLVSNPCFVYLSS